MFAIVCDSNIGTWKMLLALNIILSSFICWMYVCVHIHCTPKRNELKPKIPADTWSSQEIYLLSHSCHFSIHFAFATVHTLRAIPMLCSNNRIDSRAYSIEGDAPMLIRYNNKLISMNIYSVALYFELYFLWVGTYNETYCVIKGLRWWQYVVTYAMGCWITWTRVNYGSVKDLKVLFRFIFFYTTFSALSEYTHTLHCFYMANRIL